MPVPPRLQSRPQEYAAPGVLYASHSAPPGYRGFFVMDQAMRPVLRLEIAEDALSEEAWQTLEELRQLVTRGVTLKLVG